MQDFFHQQYCAKNAASLKFGNICVSSFMEIDRVFSSQDLSCMELVYCLKPKLGGYEPKNGIPLGISFEGDAYLEIFGKPCHFIWKGIKTKKHGDVGIQSWKPTRFKNEFLTISPILRICCLLLLPINSYSPKMTLSLAYPPKKASYKTQ